MELTTEDSETELVEWWHLPKHVVGTTKARNWQPIHSVASCIARIHRSGNKGLKEVVTSLPITQNLP